MPDNITFNTMPIDWLVPGGGIEIDPSRAVRGLTQMSRHMVVTGQRLPTGTVPANKLIRITRKEDGIKYFGRGSIIAQQIEAALRVNPYTKFSAVALDDNPAGQPAKGEINFSGLQVKAGTLYLYIGGRESYVGVNIGMTLTQIAAAVAAKINKDLDGAVTATSAGAKVMIESRHKGIEGNGIIILINYYQGEETPEGLMVDITPMAGGTANPQISDFIMAIAKSPAYTILNAFTDAANIALLEDELTNRWGGMQMRQGHSFGFIGGTYNQLANYGDARNSAQTTFLGLKGCPTLPWVVGAQFGAAIEFKGAIDPAEPFRGIPLPSVMAPRDEDQFEPEERNLLLHDGISTVTFDDAGQCFVEQVVTTYQTNTFGLDDESLRKLNTKWTVDYMAFSYKHGVLTEFPNHKLVDDVDLETIDPGQKVTAPKLIRNNLISTAIKLNKVGLQEDLAAFIKEVYVVRSVAKRDRVNAMIPPNVVNQFDWFAAAVQYIL